MENRQEEISMLAVQTRIDRALGKLLPLLSRTFPHLPRDVPRGAETRRPALVPSPTQGSPDPSGGGLAPGPARQCAALARSHAASDPLNSLHCAWLAMTLLSEARAQGSSYAPRIDADTLVEALCCATNALLELDRVDLALLTSRTGLYLARFGLRARPHRLELWSTRLQVLTRLNRFRSVDRIGRRLARWAERANCPREAVRFQLLRAQACAEAGEPFVALSRITEALAQAEPGVALETRTLLVFLTHYALEAGQFGLARRTSEQLESAERWAATLGEPPLEPPALRHWLRARLDAVHGNTARAIATFQRLQGEMEKDPAMRVDAGNLSLDLAAVLDATGREEAALTVLWIARLRGHLTQTQGKVSETGEQLLYRARTSLLGRAFKDRPPPNFLRALGG